jgi:chromosome segregation ATPase
MSRSNKGRRLRLAGVAVVVSLAVFLLATIPALAQNDTHTRQLDEAEATIADQEQIIEELRGNFFKAVGELNEEIEILRARIAQQQQVIASYDGTGAVPADQQEEIAALKKELAQKSRLADELFVDVNELSAEVALLDAQKSELEDLVAMYEADPDVSGLREKISKQEDTIAQQEGIIKELINDYFTTTDALNARVDELEAENQKLSAQAAKDSEAIMKYAKLEGNLKEQIESLKAENKELQAVRDRQQATISSVSRLRAKAENQNLSLQNKLSNCNSNLVNCQDELSETRWAEAQLQCQNNQLQLDNNKLSRQVDEWEPLAEKNTELESENAHLSQSSDTLKWLVGVLVVGGFFLAGGGL